MQTTPDEVLQNQPPKLTESTVKALPKDGSIEMLRKQRIRFDGFFTGPTW
ncbi:hypothetical protein [Mycolicibacterium stellerae]|nr:hypothetical protein [Mycolicibacterium stellerae]